VRQRVPRRAHRHGVEARSRQVADRRLVGHGQHQGQWARPEPGGQPLGPLVEAGDPPGGGDVGHMGDQGVEARPALGRVDRRHGAGVGGVGRQAIDRLGRQDDQAAAFQRSGGLGDLGLLVVHAVELHRD
jgi:hypothetical protein